METLFAILALAAALAAFPCGFLIARCCVANAFGRAALTLVFGVILLVAGVTAVVAGCSAVGGRMDFR